MTQEEARESARAWLQAGCYQKGCERQEALAAISVPHNGFVQFTPANNPTTVFVELVMEIPLA